MKLIGKSTALLTALGAVAAGIIFLFGGITLHTSTANQNRTYTGSVEATVSGYEVRQEEFETADPTNTVQDVYFPVFTYTVDGQEYTAVSDSGSGDKAYEEGSVVTLSYLPEDPTQFYVAGDSFRNFLPYVLYAVSLAAFAAAVKFGLPVLRR